MIIVLESPYAGDVGRNLAYLTECLRDSLLRGESPMASHGLYTQALNDNDPEERAIGMDAGHEFYRVAERCVVYEDLGISPGMQEGILRAEAAGVPVECRKLGGWAHGA